MNSVWKYVLRPEGNTVIKIPSRRILSTIIQDNNICIYALVDSTEKEIEYLITCVGTGHSLICAEDHVFIGTVQYEDLDEVYHIFYKVISPVEDTSKNSTKNVKLNAKDTSWANVDSHVKNAIETMPISNLYDLTVSRLPELIGERQNRFVKKHV